MRFAGGIMKTFFKKIKITSLLFSLLCLAFGIILIACPDVAKITMVDLFGGLIALYGVIQIINYFVYGYERFGFVLGALNLTCGILIISCSETLSSPAIFGVVFGFAFILNAFVKIQTSLDYHRYGATNWWMETLFGIIMLALGIVVLCDPFANEKYLLIFLGITLIIESVSQIINTIIITRKISHIKHTLRELFAKQIEKANAIDITEQQ